MQWLPIAAAGEGKRAGRKLMNRLLTSAAILISPGSRTGSYEIFRQAGPEGSGPPPHCHPWDESFYVVSGNIAFGVGDKDMIAEPGTLVHLPAGTMHWFRFGAGGGEMISMTSREAASLFFTDVDRAISPEAPDIPKLVEVANQHQLMVAAPTGRYGDRS